MIKYLNISTEFAKYLPQQRGALVVNEQANKLPDESSEQMELIVMRNAGIDVGDMIAEASPAEGPKTGRLNSRRNKKPTPQMLKAGKTPQEIGAVVAGILGFRG